MFCIFVICAIVCVILSVFLFCEFVIFFFEHWNFFLENLCSKIENPFSESEEHLLACVLDVLGLWVALPRPRECQNRLS